MYDLDGEVDLLRPFVILNGLSDLYKWWYVHIKCLTGSSYLILYELCGSLVYYTLQLNN
jgi:hypothetical protein